MVKSETIQEVVEALYQYNQASIAKWWTYGYNLVLVINAYGESFLLKREALPPNLTGLAVSVISDGHVVEKITFLIPKPVKKTPKEHLETLKNAVDVKNEEVAAAIKALEEKLSC